MKLKFVSELIQIASLRFIEALEGSKITTRINGIDFDKVDHTYNLFHDCRKMQRQMLRSKVFTVQKTVDDLGH